MTSIGIRDRIKHAWSAFREGNQYPYNYHGLGVSYGSKPDRVHLSLGNERSIIASIYTRIAVDVASVDIRHVRLDQNGRYTEEIKSGLNYCLSVSANTDQSGRAFVMDAVMSLFDEGCIAIVPVETSESPKMSNSYDIDSLRVGKIREWYPQYVRVDLYNEKTGQHEEVTLPKKMVAIVENPFYAVMNEPNSTLRRLVYKLNLLDKADKEMTSGKLDIIVQLPYTINSELKKQRAEDRRKSIEMQLTGSKYGIAYLDATEKITQLNRPAENQLVDQIKYLSSTLYNQLGLTEAIFDGTADEQAMLNYNNRTVEPILAAITEAMDRTFITKTARTQGQAIIYIRDPFKLVPVNNIADIADKFTRNEILSSNEVRSIIGFKPVDDPRADELRNKNLNANNDQLGPNPRKDDDGERRKSDGA